MNFALVCSERAVGTFGEDKSALYLSAATDVGMKIFVINAPTGFIQRSSTYFPNNSNRLFDLNFQSGGSIGISLSDGRVQ